MEIVSDKTNTKVNQGGVLTTIPFEEFMSLEEQTEDVKQSRKFNWDDFISRSNNLELLETYLDSRDCKMLGLKKSDVNGQVDGPCVLKLAIHSTKGPAQNQAEAVMLNKYQNEMECFPRLYACDNKNWYYLLAEVGTPLNSAPESFVNKQLGHLRNYFRRYLKSNELPADAELFEDDDFIVNDCDEFVMLFSCILNLLSGHGRKSDSELLWFYDMIDDMQTSGNSLVRALGDVLKYAQHHGSDDVELSDFAQPANWGFVKRDGQFMLIPIDWGASPNVVKKYYTKESKSVITFDELKGLLKS